MQSFSSDSREWAHDSHSLAIMPFALTAAAEDTLVSCAQGKNSVGSRQELFAEPRAFSSAPQQTQKPVSTPRHTNRCPVPSGNRRKHFETSPMPPPYALAPRLSNDHCSRVPALYQRLTKKACTPVCQQGPPAFWTHLTVRQTGPGKAAKRQSHPCTRPRSASRNQAPCELSDGSQTPCRSPTPRTQSFSYWFRFTSP